MKETILLLAALSATVFVGWNVLSLVSGRSLRMSLPETMAVSYGLGVGLISFEMLLFYILESGLKSSYFAGSSFTAGSILLPWVVVAAVNFMVRSKRSRTHEPCPPAPCMPYKTKVLDACLAGGILFEVAYAFFRALIKPMESYDAIAIYAIRSKIFFLAKSIPQDYFASIARLFPHADYPLNIQLFETFLYTSMGSLNDQLVKIVFPVFFTAILCILYFALRRIGGRTYGLIFTFILASIPQFNNYATNGYLEVPLAFYVLVAAIFLIRWMEGASYGCLVLSAMSAGLAGWTKNEGLLYCVIFITVTFIAVLFRGRGMTRKDIYSLLCYSGIILLVSMPWALVKAKWRIANDEIALSYVNPAYLVKQLDKLGPVFYELQKQLFGPKKWNIFWPALAAVIFVNFKKVVAMPARVLFAVIIMALAGYTLFYMISNVDVVFFASKTWSRFLLDFLPLAVYLLAVALKDDVKC